jgi:hypothetical protein
MAVKEETMVWVATTVFRDNIWEEDGMRKEETFIDGVSDKLDVAMAFALMCSGAPMRWFKRGGESVRYLSGHFTGEFHWHEVEEFIPRNTLDSQGWPEHLVGHFPGCQDCPDCSGC